MTTPRLRSYGQKEADRVIAHALAGIQKGFYVDVGAGHPVLASNTFFLYERGWRGIAIEPQRGLSLTYRKRRPEDITINAACGATPGKATLTIYPAKWGWATIDPDTKKLHAGENLAKRTERVEVTTLNDVLLKNAHWPGIDLISIDVEGSERDVLRGLSLDTWQPRLIVIESVIPGGTKPVYEFWEGMLTAYGYKCARDDGINRFYCTNPWITQRLRRIP